MGHWTVVQNIRNLEEIAARDYTEMENINQNILIFYIIFMGIAGKSVETELNWTEWQHRKERKRMN